MQAMLEAWKIEIREYQRSEIEREIDEMLGMRPGERNWDARELVERILRFPEPQRGELLARYDLAVRIRVNGGSGRG